MNPLRPASGTALACLSLASLSLVLAAIQPAEARGRFGGGHHGSTHHASGTPETTLFHRAAPEPRSHAHADSHAPSQPASVSTAIPEIAGSAALLARRAELEAARQRIRATHVRETPAGQPDNLPPVAAPSPTAPAAAAQAPAGALPTVRASRSADPDFGKTTPQQVAAVACEIKPVMSDDDYRRCGANPPSLPPLGSRY